MCHLPETLIRCSATCRLTSHLPAHHCHIPAQHNCANLHLRPNQHWRKGQHPSRQTESNDGDESAPILSPRRWAKVTGWQTKAQISSDISAVACYHRRPGVLNQNVRARSPAGRDEVWAKVWRGPERVHHCTGHLLGMPSTKGVARGSTGPQVSPPTRLLQC